jgi:hypothetical protein
MTFRHISEVLADARLTAGELAVRGHDGAHKLNPIASGENATGMQDGMSGKGIGGGPTPDEDSISPPRRSTNEGVSGRATRIGKGPEHEAPASVRGSAERWENARDSSEERMNPALRLVSSRDRCTATTAANGRPQRPAVHLSLVLVGGTHYTATGSF